MKGSVIPLAVLFISVSTASGQTISDRLSVSYSPAPMPHLAVTNNYSSPITGMFIVTEMPGGDRRARTVTRFDSAVNFRHDTPIASGHSQTFPVVHVQGSDPSVLAPQVMAVVFADGTSAGDSQWIAKLHAERRSTFEALKQIEGNLNQALTAHANQSSILDTLQSREAELKSSKMDHEARIAAHLVVYAAMQDLRNTRIGGVAGDPQRTIPAILSDFNQWSGAIRQFEPQLQ